MFIFPATFYTRHQPATPADEVLNTNFQHPQCTATCHMMGCVYNFIISARSLITRHHSAAGDNCIGGGHDVNEHTFHSINLVSFFATIVLLHYPLYWLAVRQPQWRHGRRLYGPAIAALQQATVVMDFDCWIKVSRNNIVLVNQQYRQCRKFESSIVYYIQT